MKKYFTNNTFFSFSKTYDNLFRPILKNDNGIDAEVLTNLSLNLLAFCSSRRDWSIISAVLDAIKNDLIICNNKLHQQICGINFTNPLGLAAGFDKNGVATNIWQDFGFGFSEIGTITKFPQPGNPKPRLFRLANEQAALNRMGFNNDGADALLRNFERQKKCKSQSRQNLCIGINFGKSKITPLEEAKEDYLYSMKLLISHCQYAVINVSSPNTEGLRKLQNPDRLRELLREIKTINNCPPLFVKIAPDLSFKEIDDICQLIKDENIEGIIATNTSLDRLGLGERVLARSGFKLSEEKGGLSGQPLQTIANQILKYIHNQDKDIVLIGVGGIDSPKAAWQRICSGASLIQIYTGWIYQGPKLVPEILSGLLNQLNAHGLSNINEAVGSGLDWRE